MHHLHIYKRNVAHLWHDLKSSRSRTLTGNFNRGPISGGSNLLKDRVALITGAGSGIGWASAILLAQHGAKIGALDIDEQSIIETVEAIRSKGGEALTLIADVSQPSQVQHAVEDLVAQWGRLDIVFANAGIQGILAPVDEITPDEWDELMGVNLKGTFLSIKYSVPYLRKQGGSIIVNSSVNGTRMFSRTEASAYVATKGGQAAFAKSIALQLARDRIKVNVICPGYIATNCGKNSQRRNCEKVQERVKYLDGDIPLTQGKPGQPEQVAQLVLFLASDASDLITGTEIWIDGGESLLVG